jgi:hypothetical protein
VNMNTDFYNAWGLLLQVLIWAAMIATFIVYLCQLRAMKRAAVGQNILSVVNFLQATYVRDARTTVRKRLKGKALADWTDDEKRDASLVCSTYDVAAILIFQQRLVPAEPFITNWGSSIKDCYEVSEPFITEMQKHENSGPHYWNDFAQLYAVVRK